MSIMLWYLVKMYAYVHRILAHLSFICNSMFDVIPTLKLLQRSSIRLRWRQQRREMHALSRRPRTCLQRALSRRNRVDAFQSTSSHSRRRSKHHKLQLPLSFRPRWCLEQDGSLRPLVLPPFRLSSHSRISLLFSQILMHRWASRRIHRVKTRFYEVCVVCRTN